MKILALEFSSAQRSVAVVQTDPGTGATAPSIRSTGTKAAVPREVLRASTIVAEVIEAGAGTARPVAMIDDALRQAGLEREQIDGLAVGLGPGSYTGIRAAIAMAQGWSLACDPDRLQLTGLSSAEVLAAQAQADGLSGAVNVVIDAQRGEFYLATYHIDPRSRHEVESLRIVTRAELCRREQAGEVLIGPEITHWFATGRNLFPRAATLGELAAGQSDFVSGEKLEPIYLRETKFVKAPPPRRRAE